MHLDINLCVRFWLHLEKKINKDYNNDTSSNACGPWVLGELIVHIKISIKHEFPCYEWHVIVCIEMQCTIENHSHAPQQCKVTTKVYKR